MAHNPHAPQGPQGPQGNQDPAGSTQMFRAFVDEGGPERPAAVQQAAGGPRIGVVVGFVVAIVVVAVIAWLALN
jgi:hypothetical protein